MNKILIALYVACALCSTAYVFSRTGESADAPVLVASSEPT